MLKHTPLDFTGEPESSQFIKKIEAIKENAKNTYL